MSRWAWLLAWVYIGLSFYGFWQYGLFDLDEGIYAAAAREMLNKDEWVVITLEDKPFFEKPILIYWTGMAFVKLGVPGEAALRLPSVLASIGTILLVVAFCRRRFSDRIAFWSALILASSSMFMLLGRMFTPDALLVFFMAAAFFSYWESLFGEWKWRLITAASLALATLAKGPMPVVVFFLLAVYTAAAFKEKRVAMSRGWLVGAALYVLIVALWYLPVFLKEGPVFFNEFLVKQNIGRLQGGDTAHLGPIWLYLPVVLFGLAPFSFLVFGAWMRCRSNAVEKYLWAWVLIVFLLFSVAGTKLPHYILPLFPPLAVLLACYGVQAAERFRWEFALYAIAIGILTTIPSLYMPIGAVPPLLQLTAINLGIVAIVATFFMIIAFKLGKDKPLFQGFAIAAPITFFLLAKGPANYWRAFHRDPQFLAQYAREQSEAVVEYRTGGMGVPGLTSHPSISWYLGTTPVKADWPDEAARAAMSSGSVLVISRRGRFEDAAADLQATGFAVTSLRTAGEFQLYSVAEPKNR